MLVLWHDPQPSTCFRTLVLVACCNSLNAIPHSESWLLSRFAQPACDVLPPLHCCCLLPSSSSSSKWMPDLWRFAKWFTCNFWLACSKQWVLVVGAEGCGLCHCFFFFFPKNNIYLSISNFSLPAAWILCYSRLPCSCHWSSWRPTEPTAACRRWHSTSGQPWIMYPLPPAKKSTDLWCHSSAFATIIPLGWAEVSKRHSGNSVRTHTQAHRHKQSRGQK